MVLDEQKEKLSVKIDEKKVKHEEKKAEAKVKHEERKIELKAKYTDKKISAHIEKALKIIYKAGDDADKDIIKLLDAIDSEIEADEKPIEFILYKAENKFAEIILTAEVKMQKAKNGLIKNLEKDMEKVSELVSLEEDLSTFKDEMDEVSALLDERVEIEKETLNLKA
ncbi:hypothetical protein [uncultured Methanobrevibacter sp.]|uniref:hypothetical protein n=1 Tax=uncultured Methanobrevibacter sp. TaxID=253161 RepID=UPI0025E5D37C|nr:hypothetical protein [uncultured Methanobrevibacter sp.]